MHACMGLQVKYVVVRPPNDRNEDRATFMHIDAPEVLALLEQEFRISRATLPRASSIPWEERAH